jgi:hypothetical protein
VNTQKVVGNVGRFNIGFRTEQLTSHAGTVVLQDFARRLEVYWTYHATVADGACRRRKDGETLTLR